MQKSIEKSTLFKYDELVWTTLIESGKVKNFEQESWDTDVGKFG